MANEKGLWIPEEVMTMEGFSFTHKGFIAVINALNDGNGCYASNSYFSQRFSISKDRASRIISDLAFAGAISVVIDKSARRQRTITIKDLSVKMPIGENTIPTRRKRHTPIGENTVGGTVETPSGYGENTKQIEKIYNRDIEENIEECISADAPVGENETPTKDNKKKTTKELAAEKSAKTRAAREADLQAEIIFPYDTPDFREWWGHWLDHRAIKGCSYASKKSEQMALKRLAEFDEEFSIELIKQSIDQGWQGLIFTKTPNDYQEYLKRKSHGTQNGTNGKASGSGFDFSEYARMVRSSSSNPEQYYRDAG